MEMSGMIFTAFRKGPKHLFPFKNIHWFKGGFGCFYAVWINCFCFPWVEYKRTPYSICLLYNIQWLKIQWCWQGNLITCHLYQKTDVLNILFCVVKQQNLLQRAIFSSGLALWVNWLDTDAVWPLRFLAFLWWHLRLKRLLLGWNSKAVQFGDSEVCCACTLYGTHSVAWYVVLWLSQ